MHHIEITASAFGKEQRQKVFDNFFAIIDSQLKDANGYLTLSFKIATSSPRHKPCEENSKK
jgi:hypothetical protein